MLNIDKSIIPLDKFAAHTGISQEVLRQAMDAAARGELKGSTTIPFEGDTDGNGHYHDGESKWTAGKTVNGSFCIQQPTNGSWSVTLQIGNKTYRYDNCVPGASYTIPQTETSFWGSTKIVVDAQYSQQQNVHFKVMATMNY
ncbi:hypothetical protein [Sorangium sp. So ce1099]|uniref:hypothetical protein n=1 Tax=Sorangium sp. So ce1099 TaxID=3133331 RepID=UPI003F60FCF8